jgi:hypothetical protein
MNNNPRFPSISIHEVRPDMVSVLVTKYSQGFGTVELNIGDMSITLFSGSHSDSQRIAKALSNAEYEAV